MKNNDLTASDANLGVADKSSDSHSGSRTMWVIASEVAGLEGMPTTDRRARDELERLSAGKEGVRRKRSGTKAFEYHVSILPQYVIDALEKSGLFPDGITVDHLAPKSHSLSEPRIGRANDRDNQASSNMFMDKFVLLPGYSVQVSAGYGTQAQGEEEPYQYLAFPRTWLKRRGFNEKDLAVVWSKGDSMEPTISDNASLVVHLGRTRPTDGRIFVVRNDDQLWVKRIQARPGAWVLLSDNPLYPPVEIPKDEQHTFEVIGQVVHISHDVGE